MNIIFSRERETERTRRKRRDKKRILSLLFSQSFDHRNKESMFYTIFLICLLINIGYTNNNNNRCSDVNSKLDKYGIELTVNEKDFAGLLLCQNFINNYCCPQNYEYQIQNATKTELRQLFEFYSINLYELLQQITIQLNGL